MMLSTPIATLHHHQPDLAPAAAGFFERQGDTAAQARDEAALRSSSSSRPLLGSHASDTLPPASAEIGQKYRSGQEKA
ncbi:uncharacterized protein PSANT_06580 [Moesziomyces antarcticus]|uniref:Uncharacterized protein n=1 Tax=Pseudozyma antarctica TaxID=84753 RepID=A0A5C3FZB8_PSEA2|nr:uncharacterized protein PSANT_06580 [Moesziomyces antarcticus]